MGSSNRASVMRGLALVAAMMPRRLRDRLRIRHDTHWRRGYGAARRRIRRRVVQRCGRRIRRHELHEYLTVLHHAHLVARAPRWPRCRPADPVLRLRCARCAASRPRSSGAGRRAADAIHAPAASRRVPTIGVLNERQQGNQDDSDKPHVRTADIRSAAPRTCTNPASI